jgi:deoxyadenosine/deoxycytidine kinase
MIVEGIIAAGKSTIIKQLEKAWPSVQSQYQLAIFTEVVHSVPLLEHYIQDPVKHSYELQHHCAQAYLDLIAKVVNEVQGEKALGWVIIMERSLWAVLMVFTSSLLRTGRMHLADALDIYQRYLPDWIRFVQTVPFFHIWVDTDHTTASGRYQTRNDSVKYPFDLIPYESVLAEAHLQYAHHFDLIVRTNLDPATTIGVIVHKIMHHQPTWKPILNMEAILPTSVPVFSLAVHHVDKYEVLASLPFWYKGAILRRFNELAAINQDRASACSYDIRTITTQGNLARLMSSQLHDMIMACRFFSSSVPTITSESELQRIEVEQRLLNLPEHNDFFVIILQFARILDELMNIISKVFG